MDIINSTLGKALGGAAGGYTTASRQVVDLLRQRSRPYLFSNSIPPAVAATASKVRPKLLSPYAHTTTSGHFDDLVLTIISKQACRILE